MNRLLTDKIWNLLLKSAFGPISCNPANDVPADQTVILFSSARHALNSLGGIMDETRNESGTILDVSNPENSNAGVTKLSLRFNDSQRLNGISITWQADGRTFGKLKSWLDRDVRAARCHRLGFDLACHYELDNAQIELVGNPLSCGLPCEVTLSCLLGPKGKMAAMFSSLAKTTRTQGIAA